jgi:hypothetical protein
LRFAIEIRRQAAVRAIPAGGSNIFTSPSSVTARRSSGIRWPFEKKESGKRLRTAWA